MSHDPDNNWVLQRGRAAADQDRGSGDLLRCQQSLSVQPGAQIRHVCPPVDITLDPRSFRKAPACLRSTEAGLANTASAFKETQLWDDSFIQGTLALISFGKAEK